jgi:hypothetical protein
VNRTAFYGTLYTGELEAVQSLLQAWLGAGTLNLKIRLSGEEITTEENDDFYLYCHNAMGSQGNTPYYLLEGNTSAGLDDTRQRLEGLLNLCKEQGVACDLEYVEVNEDGDEVSEQFQLE